ncbi:hypothetical protein ACLOJK_012726 [Asimina triloba]
MVRCSFCCLIIEKLKLAYNEAIDGGKDGDGTRWIYEVGVWELSVHNPGLAHKEGGELSKGDCECNESKR